MRPPLLDVELVELALQMPPELAFGGINRSLARDSVAADVPGCCPPGGARRATCGRSTTRR